MDAMDFRHEWKIEISPADRLVLRRRLLAVARLDGHAMGGAYRVRSLYFDTPGDRALREKLDGVSRREKFRLRYYNGDVSALYLAKKSKWDSLCRKESVPVTAGEAQALLEGGYGWMAGSGRDLVWELRSKLTGQLLRPKAIVDYTREPFVYAPGNVRVTLVALTMVTTVVILAVTSNVVLSLGMVGALSIVRFRTAIKEPLDIAFLFWAIAVGIVLAAGLLPLAVLGSACIGGALLALVNRKSHLDPYIVVLSCDGADSEQTARAFLEAQVQRCVVKSKTAQPGAVELNLEIRMRGPDTSFVNDLAGLEGVRSAVLVSYNGDYMG